MLKRFEIPNCVEVGIDEAGRGCLMGRVYAAAVIMPAEYPDDDSYISQIKDSKKISEKKRYLLERYIKNTAVSYGIGWAEPSEIDKHNIYQATILAMHRALHQIQLKIDHILVDGPNFKPYCDKDDDYPDYTCVVKGDNSYVSIAAASILAKCARDTNVMELVHSQDCYQCYGWEKNKGYGTKTHMDAIQENGITVFHRLSFAPCQGKPRLKTKSDKNN